MCRGNSRAHKNSWIGYYQLSRTMITGHKRKNLDQPSADKVTGGNSPRATWQVVTFYEVIFPIVMAVIFVIAYTFVKSFPTTSEKMNAQPLIRIAVVPLGLIVWNVAVPSVQFLFSVLLGRMIYHCVHCSFARIVPNGWLL